MKIHPGSRKHFNGVQWWFVAWAAVVAMSVLAFYVQLLHESVARGERWLRDGCFKSTPSPAATAATLACRR